MLDYAWHTGEDGEVFVRELARVPEGEVGAPTPAPIGRGLETIRILCRHRGGRACTACYGLGRIPRGIRTARKVEDGDNAAPPHGEAAQAVVELAGPSVRAYDRAGPRQAAQAFLDTWDVRAGDDDDNDDMLTAVAALRAALAARASISTSAGASHLQKDKASKVLAMLRPRQGRNTRRRKVEMSPGGAK